MSQGRLITTNEMAATLRPRIVRPGSKEILISRIAGSDQEPDLTVPPNCGGLGRIRHFHRETADGWPPNSLPIDPACKALGVEEPDLLRAQVFQNAACAWRCWYCYVPYNLLSGDSLRGEWVTTDHLVECYLAENGRPQVLDLSGGSPDLTPEWVVWMMESLEKAGLAEETYLWSDDNLSTDFVLTKLTNGQRRRLAEYRNYGRVCCFKGFDARSFSFNTKADDSGFDRQFEIFKLYLDLGLDLYAYATFTGDEPTAVEPGVVDFLDRLQSLATNLPLRLIPLQITPFGPLIQRTEEAELPLPMSIQDQAIRIWSQEIEKRFTLELRQLPIADVELET